MIWSSLKWVTYESYFFQGLAILLTFLIFLLLFRKNKKIQNEKWLTGLSVFVALLVLVMGIRKDVLTDSDFQKTLSNYNPKPSPRHLSDQQRSYLVRKLRGIGSYRIVIRYSSVDLESKEYLKDFESLFNELGWRTKVEPDESHSRVGVQFLFGNYPGEGLNPVIIAFGEIGIPNDSNYIEHGIKRNEFVLYVGSNK